MSLTQEFIQPDQLSDLYSPSLTTPTSTEPLSTIETPISCPLRESVSALQSQEAPINDTRKPLKELSEHSKGNQEVANQEQEQEQEESEESSEKVNDYVAKVLERLMKQKNKMAQLSAILERKGLKASQVNEIIQGLDETSNETTEDLGEFDARSKENLSPVKTKPTAVKSEGSGASQEKAAVVATPAAQKASVKQKFEDILQISRKSIAFGRRFPGQIVEEDFEIVNKSGQDFIVQIHINCLNEELEDTDEYVFSVRRNHLYDYNDKHYLIMAPYSSASFKFALKVPNLKIVGDIEGQVKITIQNLPGCHTVDLSASVAIPRVYCPKELSCNGLDYKVVKLAIKEGKKQEIKLPIRNDGDVPVTLELEFYEPKGEQESAAKSMFDCLVHPSIVTINPNSVGFANISIKPWKGLSLIKGLGKQCPARKILAARVRDSALVYSFVLWIEFY